MTTSTFTGAPLTMRDDGLRTAVLTVIVPLQAQQQQRVPSATARLARLRRALMTTPGSEPDVWADTVGALPATLQGRDDTPSRYEQAAHVAICLYALHQQSQALGMHRQGEGLGLAVQRLHRATSEDPETGPVLRRFRALATATAFAETTHHLRGLVTQLRGHGLALDYGQLAVELRRLQAEPGAGKVRLTWGRDLYRARRPEADGGTTSSDRDLALDTTPLDPGEPA